MTLPDKINTHLSEGGIIHVAAFGKTVTYCKCDAGRFSMCDNVLFVRHCGFRYVAAFGNTVDGERCASIWFQPRGLPVTKR